VFNEQTHERAEQLKPYFQYIPIYQMNSGYLSIISRAVIGLLKSHPDPENI